MKNIYCLMSLLGLAATGFAQSPPAAPPKLQCKIAPPPDPGEESLSRGHYDEAAQYFAAQPPSS